MNANMMKQKIWYFIWIMFIKIYFSHKVSKYCTRIKTNKTWRNQGYSGTHEENFRNWTYKNPKTADRYSRPADQEARLFVYPIWDVCNPDTGM